MSAPRDTTPRPSVRALTGSRRSVREPTESIEPLSEPAELPMGTRDEPPHEPHTRIESPVARVRTPSQHRPPPPPQKPGTDERIGQVLGAYRLLELIGKGGMGFVYRAEHVRLGREVALKLLRTDYAKRRDAVSRFFQEARTVNRVRHRNIVDVTDFIELEDGTTFIIMELLRGKSLGAWSRHGFELPRALAALIQICDGLAAAHAVGVIHRDLKPDNIVIVPTPDGAELVKLLDFGVAKLLNRDDEDIGLETAAGSVIGTPAYMSPEQAGGLVVDHRADIYSLGAIMYELFCGQPLFRGRSFGEYVRKHLNEQPVPPRDTPGGKTMDVRLEALLLRCLCKDPNGRYPHAEALRDDLLHLLAAIETHEHDLVAIGRTSSVRNAAPGRDVPPHARATVVPPGYATMMAQGHPGALPAGGGPTPYPDPSAMVGFGGLTPYPGAGSAWVDGRRRARWLWGVGAAAVVGLGVAGALVAASGERKPPAVQAAPVPAAPDVTSLAAAAPQPPALIKVAVDAPTGAHIEAVGSTLLLCTTPCTLVIDPADGGSTTRRDFVVKKDDLRDATFSIDLARPPPSIVVAMEAPPAPPPVVVAPPTPPAVERDPRRPGRTPRGGKPGGKPEPVAATPTPPPAVAPPVVAPPPVEPPPPPPVRPTGTGRKPRDKVDPTATIDPFAPKK